ncbi:galactokinase [Oligosphaera ethanolica]|uniref:Galactokinase n=1 Tax=Oligosphaera ethanolica TaxID=760260 RepID=A0AAE3VF17_9BACT|nr:galactokinase [Oligosphaera ethanolica]MDQ0289265.1 galactokinase [Oligosphaera ethanolica]
MKERLIQAFTAKFGQAPTVLSRAPGRLEILGNHTDYNEGTVLSVAVDREMTAAAAPVAGKTCRLLDAVTGSERSFEIDKLDRPKRGDWANYIKGLIVEFQKRGKTVPAFNAAIGGTVPMSAGMSSSAALEMAMTLIIRQLAKADDISWQDCARIGQACENNYVGAKTGLLDQFSSLKGKAGQLVYSDFRSLEVQNVPIPAGTAFVVANCMVKHNLTNEYNERREACEDAARTLAGIYPGVKTLRDVSLQQLEAAKERLKPLSYRRALHVVGEITRVADGVAALQRGDIKGFGRLMYESQYSSSHHFENSCKELDMLVDIARELPGALGARLSGGGFGGITVHLVRAEVANEYQQALIDAYATRSGLKADVMICKAADGAELLSL